MKKPGLIDKNFVTTQRIASIDGLRGLACLAVVVYHYGAPFNTYYPSDTNAPYNFAWGELGVQLFFMISGFVILLSAVKSGNSKLFFISRFSRLYPAYWGGLILSSLTIYIVGIETRSISLLQVLLNATMFQRFMLVDNVDQVYWTLAVEMQFYIIVFLYLYIVGNQINRDFITRFSIFWSLLGLIICLFFNDQQYLIIGKLMLWVFLAQHAPLFCFGMAVFLYSNDRKFSLLIPAFGIVSAVNTGIIQGVDHGLVVGVLALLFWSVIWFHNNAPYMNKWLTNGPLQFLGKISYSLYLTHTVLGFAIIHVSQPLLGVWGSRFFTFSVVLIVAMLLYQLAERKLSYLMRNRLTRALVR